MGIKPPVTRYIGGYQAPGLIYPGSDGPKEKCGVLGLWIDPRDEGLFRNMLKQNGMTDYGDNFVAATGALNLRNINHRGQESAGIVTQDGEFHRHVGMGMAHRVFTPNIIGSLPGNMLVGHVRYSTHGESSITNAQPLENVLDDDRIYTAHNGSLTNYTNLSEIIRQSGWHLNTTVDSEVMPLLINMQDRDLPLFDRIALAMGYVEGSNSSVFMVKDAIYCYADARKYRPLVIAKIGNGSYCIASEDGCITRTFRGITADIEIEEVKPGQLIEIKKGKKRAKVVDKSINGLAHCIVELFYNVRPDGTAYGIPVSPFRILVGRLLSKVAPVKADYVVPVLDSGLLVAEGYSMESRIPLVTTMIRDHTYSTRSFMQPSQELRERIAQNKQIPLPGLITTKIPADLKDTFKSNGPPIIVQADDSMIRSTTQMALNKGYRALGVKEVHLRIALPPVTQTCNLGTDIPSLDQLIAADKNHAAIIEQLGPPTKSLAFLPPYEVFRALDIFAPGTSKDFCYMCIPELGAARVMGSRKE